MSDAMWAVRYDRYGPPEVLTTDEVPRPRPRRGEALVRVVATSVNRLDLVYRSGAVRLHGAGFPKGTGFDLLGVVEETPDPHEVPVGQLVWGMLGIEPLRRRGALAEYVALDRGRYGLVHGLDPDPALAALPLAASTALVALRDTLGTRPGHRVLVVGGSGGVGTAAIQLAQVLGATVDAVTSGANRDLCTGLGAGTVHDYTTTPPSAIDERYDGVLVAAGSPAAYRSLVRPTGRIVCVAGDDWLRDLPGVVLRRPRVRMISVGPSPRDLEWLAAQVLAGTLRPVIDTTYPVADVVAAHRAAASGHARGKRVVVSPGFA